MYKQEGFATLYRGFLLNTFATTFANSIFFYVYTDGKKKYNYDPQKPYSMTTLIISLRAGLAA